MTSSYSHTYYSTYSDPPQPGARGTWGDWSTWGTFSTWQPVEGSTTVTRYYLTSPVQEIGPASRSPYAELVRVRTGSTVVKRGGVWQTVRNKRQDWLDACDVVLRGGYENEVTSARRTELIAAGYTVESRSEQSEGPDSGQTWGGIASWTARSAW